jgi:hypothetical protein
LCFAAEISARENRPVRLSELKSSEANAAGPASREVR